MSVPTTLFIDTSIFDGFKYDFQSPVVKAFISAISNREFRLLLPYPIELEIQRHMKERSEEAWDSINKAASKSPFLKRWKNWPLKQSEFFDTMGIHNIVVHDWKLFLENFNVQRLECDRIDLREVLGWYDNARPPFGGKGKKSEFPDAFAVSSIKSYNENKSESVAIVSMDKDYQAFCNDYTNLLYFKSIASFTQLMLSDEKHAEMVLNKIDRDYEILIDPIIDTFLELGFYADFYVDADVESVEVDNVEVHTINLINLGDQVCTVAFECQIDYNANVTFNTRNYTENKPPSNIHESETLSGVAKIIFDDVWENINSIGPIEFDSISIDVDLYKHFR